MVSLRFGLGAIRVGVGGGDWKGARAVEVGVERSTGVFDAEVDATVPVGLGTVVMVVVASGETSMTRVGGGTVMATAIMADTGGRGEAERIGMVGGGIEKGGIE